VLTGLEAHDVIKKEQEKEALKGRLAGISAEQPSAVYASEVAKTLAGAGDVPGALGAFEAERRLTPPPPVAPKLRTVSPGEGVYDPATGETVTPIAKPPAPEKIFNVGGQLYRYDDVAKKAVKLTDKETEEVTLGTGAIRYRKTPEGEYVEVARGRDPTPAGGEDERTKNLKIVNYINRQVETEANERYGKLPPETVYDPDLSEWVINPEYSKKFKERSAFVSKRKGALSAEMGIEQPLIPEPLAPPSPAAPEYPFGFGGAAGGTLGESAQPPPVTIPPEYKANFDIMRANPNNAGFTDQELLNALIGK
jgi:hypothetical protein